MHAERIKERKRIDAICDRFELLWQSGDRPQIQDHLDASVLDQDELFAQLFAVELDYQRSQGQSFSVDEYRAAYPTFGDSIDRVLKERSSEAPETVSVVNGEIRTPSISRSGQSSTSDRSDAGEVAVPDQLGRYRSLRLLGRGDSGSRYGAAARSGHQVRSIRAAREPRSGRAVPSGGLDDR